MNNILITGTRTNGNTIYIDYTIPSINIDGTTEMTNDEFVEKLQGGFSSLGNHILEDIVDRINSLLK